MMTRSSVLGWGAKGLFLGATFAVATGCTTLRRSSSPGQVVSVEESDALAGVELDGAEMAVASAPGSTSQPGKTQPGAVEVAWTDNGKNIQLVKLPKVQPVTASMLTLDKGNAMTFGKASPAPAGDLPPRGTRKD